MDCVSFHCRRDNIFGAYQFSLDAKELAYSQVHPQHTHDLLQAAH
eukprot:SAG31_NODE_72_length_27821_cov_26.870572_6_plen_45_part_00